jgi:hypothetical protein
MAMLEGYGRTHILGRALFFACAPAWYEYGVNKNSALVMCSSHRLGTSSIFVIACGFRLHEHYHPSLKAALSRKLPITRHSVDGAFVFSTTALLCMLTWAWQKHTTTNAAAAKSVIKGVLRTCVPGLAPADLHLESLLENHKN